MKADKQINKQRSASPIGAMILAALNINEPILGGQFVYKQKLATGS